MAIDRDIKKLRGSSKEIRETINHILTDGQWSTSYVMGVDKNDECLWCCQPGEYDERTNFKMKELHKVYVWIGSVGCPNSIEVIYQ